MTVVLIKKGNLDTDSTQGRTTRNCEAEVGKTHLQAKEHCRRPAKHRKLGDRPAAELPEGTNPAETLTSIPPKRHCLWFTQFAVLGYRSPSTPRQLDVCLNNPSGGVQGSQVPLDTLLHGGFLRCPLECGLSPNPHGMAAGLSSQPSDKTTHCLDSA